MGTHKIETPEADYLAQLTDDELATVGTDRARLWAQAVEGGDLTAKDRLGIPALTAEIKRRFDVAIGQITGLREVVSESRGGA